MTQRGLSRVRCVTLMPQFLWKSQMDDNKQWGKEAITLVDFEASPLKNIYISHSPASEIFNSWECLCFLIFLWKYSK